MMIPKSLHFTFRFKFNFFSLFHTIINAKLNTNTHNILFLVYFFPSPVNKPLEANGETSNGCCNTMRCC
jgi:hypothetical protein